MTLNYTGLAIAVVAGVIVAVLVAYGLNITTETVTVQDKYVEMEYVGGTFVPKYMVTAQETNYRIYADNADMLWNAITVGTAYPMALHGHRIVDIYVGGVPGDDR